MMKLYADFETPLKMFQYYFNYIDILSKSTNKKYHSQMLYMFSNAIIYFDKMSSDDKKKERENLIKKIYEYDEAVQNTYNEINENLHDFMVKIIKFLLENN